MNNQVLLLMKYLSAVSDNLNFYTDQLFQIQ